MTHVPPAHPEILLRPWQDSDLPTLLDIFAVSTDLGTQYSSPVTTVAEAARCRSQMLWWDDANRNFAIVTENDGNQQAVGNVGVSIDRRHDTGWVSYFSSSAVRGRGLVARSTAAVANWALSELELFRLELGHRVNNPASGAVALTAGFVQEGRERQKLRHGTERFDVLTYGRLATDPQPLTPAVTLQAP